MWTHLQTHMYSNDFYQIRRKVICMYFAHTSSLQHVRTQICMQKLWDWNEGEWGERGRNRAQRLSLKERKKNAKKHTHTHYESKVPVTGTCTTTITKIMFGTFETFAANTYIFHETTTTKSAQQCACVCVCACAWFDKDTEQRMIEPKEKKNQTHKTTAVSVCTVQQ